MSERLWHLLSGKLDEIAALYKVRPRITLIVRVPGKPKECVFLGDDSWADAVATVRDLHGDPTAFAAGPPEPVAAATLAPPPAPEAEVLPVCLECSFASGGHVHVNREDGTQAVRYPTPEEWNAALRRKPYDAAVREAAELQRLLSLYAEWNCRCEPAYCVHLGPLMSRFHQISAFAARGEVSDGDAR